MSQLEDSDLTPNYTDFIVPHICLQVWTHGEFYINCYKILTDVLC
ncbi:unnamed protein product, partial [Staurois parvus]